MKRTRIEIETELELLNDLAEQLTSEDPTGNSNQDAIHTQITVIKFALTPEQIRCNYDEDDFLLEAALNAERWLRHDDEAPSETWQEEIQFA